MKSVPQVVEVLEGDGIHVLPEESCQTALIVTEGARKIRQSQAYLTGAVELQDVSSQSAMARIVLSEGARVLDYCAGGGGKTLALAAMAQGGVTPGQFFAHDIAPGRAVAAEHGVAIRMQSGD